jgi:hypothetical protein
MTGRPQLNRLLSRRLRRLSVHSSALRLRLPPSRRLRRNNNPSRKLLRRKSGSRSKRKSLNNEVAT